MPPASHATNRAVHLRDAGLRKVSVATRVLVVGSVAAAGPFAALAAWAQPGRSKTSSTAGGQSLPVASIGRTSVSPLAPPTTVARGNDDDRAPPATVPVTAPAQNPSGQYIPPSYQYSPPVVSHAT